MSTTTTTTTLLTQQDHLRDYTIRLTGSHAPPPQETEKQDEHISLPPRSPSPQLESYSPSQPSPSHTNPPGWETSYRQVPPYRPVNRNLDAESRPWGAHGGQSPVVFTLMHGVWLKASVAWLWRKTGGRVNDEVFRTTIGGES